MMIPTWVKPAAKIVCTGATIFGLGMTLRKTSRKLAAEMEAQEAIRNSKIEDLKKRQNDLEEVVVNQQKIIEQLLPKEEKSEKTPDK